jgi:Tfp pilus assembly protein PilF
MAPNSGQAYYQRGLLYQSQGQHKYAIDDFTTAIPLIHGQAEPYVARGLSQLALGDAKAAASDLDEAVQTEPANLTAWTSRGLAYERLGDKEKAAGSYAKALNINRDHDAAKKGFARVGGQTGRTYQAF